MSPLFDSSSGNHENLHAKLFKLARLFPTATSTPRPAANDFQLPPLQRPFTNRHTGQERNHRLNQIDHQPCENLWSKIVPTKILANLPASSTLSILLNTRIFNSIKHKNCYWIHNGKGKRFSETFTNHGVYIKINTTIKSTKHKTWI